ncbi:unnamed protein product, partial [Discosporangium mesarthrocarpum]
MRSCASVPRPRSQKIPRSLLLHATRSILASMIVRPSPCTKAIAVALSKQAVPVVSHWMFHSSKGGISPCLPWYAGTNRARHGAVLLLHSQAVPTSMETDKAHKPNDAKDEDPLDEVRKNDEGFPKSSNVRMNQADSNVALLARECGVGQAVLGARRALASRLYLGLDISTRSTGYTVLMPHQDGGGIWDSLVAESEQSEGLACGAGALRELGKASVVEWGLITTQEGKDILDFGDIITQRLGEVGHRCSGVGVEGNGDGRRREWVVGVEDFMKTFGPGRFNTRALFTLAQLNGIVKFSCLKAFGAKAEAYHPTTARAFYGLLKNKAKRTVDIKKVVRDFVLSRDGGDLEGRYDWPTESDGSLSSGSFDVTDAYLVASYAWHQDVLAEVVGSVDVRKSFVAAYRKEHAERIARAEERAVKRVLDADTEGVSEV